MTRSRGGDEGPLSDVRSSLYNVRLASPFLQIAVPQALSSLNELTACGVSMTNTFAGAMRVTATVENCEGSVAGAVGSAQEHASRVLVKQ